MPAIQYLTPDGWKIANGAYGSGPPDLEMLTDIYNVLWNGYALASSGNIGKPNLYRANMVVTTDAGKDSIDYADYAGKIVIGTIGIKTDNTTQSVTQATGYALTVADDGDAVLLAGGATFPIIDVEGLLHPTFALTGVGTTAAWDTGAYKTVQIFYCDLPTGSTSGMKIFTATSVAGQTTYNSSIVAGMVPQLATFGQQILTYGTDYNIVGSNVVLAWDPADIPAGLKILVAQWT